MNVICKVIAKSFKIIKKRHLANVIAPHLWHARWWNFPPSTKTLFEHLYEL